MPRISVVSLSASTCDVTDPMSTSAPASSSQLPRSIIIGGATGGAITLIGIILVIVLCIQQSRVRRKYQERVARTYLPRPFRIESKPPNTHRRSSSSTSDPVEKVPVAGRSADVSLDSERDAFSEAAVPIINPTSPSRHTQLEDHIFNAFTKRRNEGPSSIPLDHPEPLPPQLFVYRPASRSESPTGSNVLMRELSPSPFRQQIREASDSRSTVTFLARDGSGTPRLVRRHEDSGVRVVRVEVIDLPPEYTRI